MMRAMRLFIPTLIASGFLQGCALSDKKVDQPIADTYQPLEGAAWNHRYSPELLELRAWQDAKTSFEAEYQPEPGTIQATSSVPADRIQEPQPAPLGSGNAEPDIEEDEASLRIRD